MRCSTGRIVLLIGALMLPTAAGCGNSVSKGTSNTSGGSELRVSAATWHDGAWPLTVSSGVLGCAPPGNGAITFKVNGTVYGLNSAARGAGYPPVDPIWKIGPGGARADLVPMLSKGLNLCTGLGY